MKFKKWTIALFSIVFYAWGAPTFIFFLIGSSVIDYSISKNLSPSKKNRKWFLWASLILNISLLFYFKYANFFVDNVSSVSEAFGFSSISFKEVLLPIGISFFTFQKISYVMDVYSGKNERLDNFLDYIMYIIMFPQLIAGPIVRYKDVSDQIKNYDSNKFDQKLHGLYRFIIGLSKKIFIANTFAEIVENVNLLGIENMSALDSWIGILAYTFQIYYDFAGYSDMAIGLGYMIGFKFPENFNFPYLSTSITEFWQRWHITLGAWMRDYLYIPLGGNRVSNPRIYFNLLFVFFISGFWHGANWNFIIWGLFHGFFLMIERAGLSKLLNKLPRFIQISYTFFVVVISWVFFSMDFETSIPYLQKMFSFNNGILNIPIDSKTWIITILGVLSAFVAINEKLSLYFNALPIKLANANFKFSIVIYPTMVILFFLSFITLMTSGFNPFIYYRF
jgi:alginate O-acetyltransferase complex protein AlgI